MAVNCSNGLDSSKKELSVTYEEITIPAPWGHISGKWWGTRNQQPVLAIHGWQDNAGTFDNLAPLLANDIPVLCIDLPGHGLSSHYPPGQYYYLFWDGILVVRRLVRQFRWTKLKILGHSLGGAIAFLYAATYPEDIDSYACIDVASPSVFDLQKIVSGLGAGADIFLKYEDLSEDNVPCYSYKDMISLVFDAYRGELTRECCEILMKRGMRPALQEEGKFSFSRDARLKVPSMGFLSLDQVMEFASKIKCSVLNIRGNPGMKWANPEHYDLVLDEVQDSARYMERHIVAGTHHLHLNDPKSVADIIRKFLLRND